MRSCFVAVGSATLTPHHAGMNPHRSIARSAFREAGSITEAVRARSSRPAPLQLLHPPRRPPRDHRWSDSAILRILFVDRAVLVQEVLTRTPAPAQRRCAGGLTGVWDSSMHPWPRLTRAAASLPAQQPCTGRTNLPRRHLVDPCAARARRALTPRVGARPPNRS